ncbi:MAG: protein kinase [Polyangia bacterium]|jgi:serine/threonine-protein kinase|nr:protein kinase [Polyangia bacterium]
MADELSPGQVLSETYRLVEIIGKGGMGEVWRARHERLPKEVAVKVLNASILGDETSLARFRREAEIATRLDHPGIVGVLDWNTLPGGVPYMVMELLSGESLRDRLRRGRLPLPELTSLLRQVGAALAEAHRQGVVHRDLKPDNIFLVPEASEDGLVTRAKILDFGISKIQGRGTALTQEAEVLGTPVYMAPEQAAGRLGTVSGATDQYALATIAYEALSGEIAFSGHTIIEVLARILEDDPKPLEDLVPGLPDFTYAAVRRALSKRPDERFESVTAFVEAFSGGRPASSMQAAVLSTSQVVAPHQAVSAEGDGAFARTMASAPALPALTESGKQEASASPQAGPGSLAASGGTGPGDGSSPGPVATSCERASEPFVTHPTTSAGEALSSLPEKRRVRLPLGLLLGAVLVALVAVVIIVLLVSEGGRKVGPDHRDETGLASGGAPRPDGTARHIRDSSVPSRDVSVSRIAQDAAPARGSARDAESVAPLEPRRPAREDPAGGPVREPPRRLPEPGMDRPTEKRPAPRGEGLNPQANEKLIEARAAIGRGDWATAIRTSEAALRLASSAAPSERQRVTSAASFFTTMAHCGRRDLRLARPFFERLYGGQRRRAQAFCRRHGIEL